jgi:hypothetical protein
LIVRDLNEHITMTSIVQMAPTRDVLPGKAVSYPGLEFGAGFNLGPELGYGLGSGMFYTANKTEAYGVGIAVLVGSGDVDGVGGHLPSLAA